MASVHITVLNVEFMTNLSPIRRERLTSKVLWLEMYRKFKTSLTELEEQFGNEKLVAGAFVLHYRNCLTR